MSFWGPVAAAGITSAAGLLGGFMNRGMSQRDAMWMQNEVARNYADWSAKHLPKAQMLGLKKAGINPMLPYANGGSPPIQQMTPSIAPAINPGEDLAQGVSSGVSSAIDLFRSEGQVAKMFAEIDNIVANTGLTEQQTVNATAEQRRIFADEVLKIGQAVLNSEQVTLLQTNRELLESQIAINKWRELYEKSHSELAAAGVPLAEADAEFYQSRFGEFLRWLERMKDSINPFGGSGIGKPFYNPPARR